MGAMQSRPPLPTQASLFDAPPGPDTPPDGVTPALDDAVPAVEADPPPLPLPGFLAAGDAPGEDAASHDGSTGDASTDDVPPADDAEMADPDADAAMPPPPPARPAKTR